MKDLTFDDDVERLFRQRASSFEFLSTETTMKSVLFAAVIAIAYVNAEVFLEEDFSGEMIASPRAAQRRPVAA